jgi:hypothetical protein
LPVRRLIAQGTARPQVAVAFGRNSSAGMVASARVVAFGMPRRSRHSAAGRGRVVASETARIARMVALTAEDRRWLLLPHNSRTCLVSGRSTL